MPRVRIEGVGVVNFPAGMDEASISHAIQTQILPKKIGVTAKSRLETMRDLPPIESGVGSVLGDAASQTVSDVFSDFLPSVVNRAESNLVGGINALLNPIDTASALVKEKAGHMGNAKRAYLSGDIGTGVAESFRATPFSGMLEQAGRQVVGTLSGDREQAADLVGDLATAAVPEGAPMVKGAVNQLGSSLRKSAPQQYVKALDPKLKPDVAAGIAPRMMDEGLGPTRGAIAGLDSRLVAANKALAEAEAKHGSRSFDASAIIRDIAKERHSLRTPDGNALTGPSAAAANNLYQELIQSVRNSARNDRVTLRDAVKLRDDWDFKAKKGGAFSKSGFELGEAETGVVYDSAAGPLRQRINSIDEVGKANAEVNYLLDAKKALEGATLDGGQSFVQKFLKSDSKLKPFLNEGVDRTFGPRGMAAWARAQNTVGKMLGGEAPAPAKPAAPPWAEQPTGFEVVPPRPIPQTQRFRSDAERLAFEQGAREAMQNLGFGASQPPAPHIPPLAHARGAGTVVPGPNTESGFAVYAPGGIDPDFAQVRPSPNLRSAAEDGAYLGGQMDAWEGMAQGRSQLILQRRAELIRMLQERGYSNAQAPRVADMLLGMEGL